MAKKEIIESTKNIGKAIGDVAFEEGRKFLKSPLGMIAVVGDLVLTGTLFIAHKLKDIK